jgi:hypothetical protein
LDILLPHWNLMSRHLLVMAPHLPTLMKYKQEVSDKY